MSEKKIGLFGGTFNPPHKGHLNAAKHFCELFDLSTLYIVPTYITPLKEMEKHDSPEERFMLSKLCFSKENFGETEVICSDCELMRKSSYTIDTVNYLLEKEKTDKIFLYVGSDMFFTLEAWKNNAELFKSCIIVTLARENGDRAELYSQKDVYIKKYGADIRIMDLSPLEISATDIRVLFHADNFPENYLDIKNILTENVFWYIINNTLYVNGCFTADILRCEIQNYVKGASRLSHIYAVEKRAEYLCRFFNDKELLENARVAALLHDITRELSPEEQLKLYKKYGIEVTEDELLSLGVRHSRTGAYFAREHFLINQKVFDAIYCHTTGKAAMSLLEKIIFIADYTDETRAFPNAISVRNELDEALENGFGEKAIDSAVLTAINNTVEHLAANGKKIHNDTLKAMSYINEMCK